MADMAMSNPNEDYIDIEEEVPPSDDEGQETKEVINEEYFKKKGYVYPLDFILSLRNDYKDVHRQLNTAPVLKKTFKPQSIQRKYTVDTKTTEITNQQFEDMIKQSLNKLSANNFKDIVADILKINTFSKEKLITLSNMIIHKAINETTYTDLYADLCFSLKHVKSLETTFISILLLELKNTFDMRILIDPEDAKKYDSSDSDEYDLIECKNDKIGIVNFVSTLYLKKIVSLVQICKCFNAMFNVINKCHDLKTITARDMIVECLAKMITVTKTHAVKEKGNDNYVKCLTISKEIGETKTCNRVGFLMLDALDGIDV